MVSPNSSNPPAQVAKVVPGTSSADGPVASTASAENGLSSAAAAPTSPEAGIEETPKQPLSVKIKALLAAKFPKFVAQWKTLNTVKEQRVPLSSNEKLLVGIVAGTMSAAMLLMFGVSVKTYKSIKHSMQAGLAADKSHGQKHATMENVGLLNSQDVVPFDDSLNDEFNETSDLAIDEHGKHQEGRSILTQENIPKSVSARQDGVMEAGQDLLEPEITASRGLAALLNDGLKVEGPPKFVNLFDVISGSRSSASGEAVVMADFVLVLSDYEAQKEASAKEVQFKSVIASLIADRTREDLRSFKGASALKGDIQRELNHLMRNGRIKDVLFSKFLVR